MVVRRLALLGGILAIGSSAVLFAVVRPGSTGSATSPAALAPTPGAIADPSAMPSLDGELGAGMAIGRSPATANPGAPGSSLPTVEIPGRSVARAGPPGLLGPLDSAASVDFGLALRVRDQAAIDAYLAGLYDPSSPNYRQFLTAAQFGARFGLPAQRIAALERWASGEGFDVLGGYDQRTVLRLRATAGLLASVFSVHLGQYLDPGTGITFHSPLDGAVLPPVISDAVAGLTGLDSRPAHPRPRIVAGRAPAAIPPDGLGPVDIAKAYDIVPMYEAGLLGDGQTIAIISFDTFNQSDIDVYDKQFGIDGPPTRRIPVGTAIKAPGDGTVEVALDIEVVRAVAPHAQILNYEAINGSGISQGDIVDKIVQDGLADIISDSWGVCDEPDFFGSGSRERTLRSLEVAAAAGISMFVASGDHGAFDCWSFDPTDHRVSIDFPSGSPWTVSVGGTALSVRADGTYLSEAGWQEFLSTGGTGGGLNPTEPRPSWQQGPGVDNEFSDGKRQSPDVAASASGESAYQVFVTKPGAKGEWHNVGGTSAAAPFWAASTLLIRQLADQAGVGPLGFVNPMLYAIADSPSGPQAFHDVTRGGNLRHPATPGWDFATGLGSPDVTGLAGAIVTYLREHPAP